MRVAMLTPTEADNSVADYARELTAGLEKLPDVQVQVVPITPGRQPVSHYIAQSEVLNAPDVDVVHIQHRYEFWGEIRPNAAGFWELRYLIKKPVVLTAHDTASLETLLARETSRSPLFQLKARVWRRNHAFRDSIEIAPYATALTIVFTPEERETLLARGAKPAYVVVIPPRHTPRTFAATRNVYKRAMEIFNEGPHHPQIVVP